MAIMASLTAIVADDNRNILSQAFNKYIICYLFLNNIYLLSINSYDLLSKCATISGRCHKCLNTHSQNGEITVALPKLVHPKNGEKFPTIIFL